MGEWAYIKGLVEFESAPNNLRGIGVTIPPIVSHRRDGTMKVFADADEESDSYYIAIVVHEKGCVGKVCDKAFNKWISKVSRLYPITSLLVRIEDSLGYKATYDDHTWLLGNYFINLGNSSKDAGEKHD